MMGLFGSKKDEFCAICKKSATSTSKPKKEWNIQGQLCADCYVDLMKKPVAKKTNDDDKCIACGDEPGGLNLWKPKKEWGLKGWLCEPCFNEWEKSDGELKKNCIVCNVKLGFITRRAKKEWNLKGYLCKRCWTIQESRT
jgi:hypothetical protein